MDSTWLCPINFTIMYCHSRQCGRRQLRCSWLNLSMVHEWTEWESSSLSGLQWPSSSGGNTDVGTSYTLATIRICFLLRICSAFLSLPSMYMERTNIFGQEENRKGKQASLPKFCNYKLQGNMKWILLNNLDGKKLQTKQIVHWPVPAVALIILVTPNWFIVSAFSW